MSIVYDYLKQIQASKETKKPAPVPPAPSGSSPSKRSFRASFALIAAISVAALVMIGIVASLLVRRSEKTIVKVYQPAAQPQPAKTARSDPGYVLEGIIYNPSRPFAIMNGKMLEKGSQIGDFEVMQITPDAVSLKDTRDGTSRTIQL
jgi:hypothetical protein